MHFPKGQLPSARGFWSLTMYDDKYFFVSNPINRYSVSARQKLKANPDGSTDLYIQKESPGVDKESNWLPSPADKFILKLRSYWHRRKQPVDQSMAAWAATADRCSAQVLSDSSTSGGRAICDRSRLTHPFEAAFLGGLLLLNDAADATSALALSATSTCSAANICF